MQKALIVGINYYEYGANLQACVNDAIAMKEVLEINHDETRNFETQQLLATDARTSINRSQLKDAITKFFKEDINTALFYYSGHGHIEPTGGYLIASDSSSGDAGLPMSELLYLANQSTARNKIIILDCCHAGLAGNYTPNDKRAIITNGMTILTASSAEQVAIEKNGNGVFTALLVEALKGGAGDLLGNITPASIYAYIDKALGYSGQRPIFKTNTSAFVSLRRAKPSISWKDLRAMTTLFPSKETSFELDPSYEFSADNPIEEHVKKFQILQKYHRVNLVVPVDEDFMYFAAMNSKSCKLTVLGQYYWGLIKNKKIYL